MSSSRKLMILVIALSLALVLLLGTAVLLEWRRLPAADTQPTPTGTTAQTQPDTTAGAVTTLPAPDTTAAATAPTTPETTPPPQTEPSQPDTPVSADGISYPCGLDGGKLELISLFQFTGSNPDCGGESGTDVAAIQLKNTSGAHLTQATISMTMASGAKVRFTIHDLPAGGTITAFSDENTSIKTSDRCTGVSCESSYEAASPLMADQVEIAVQGVTITLTNISGADLNDLVVYCHSLLGTDCYGGVTYAYPIDSLPAGTTVSINAWDCYLGGAEVVRIGSNS